MINKTASKVRGNYQSEYAAKENSNILKAKIRKYAKPLAVAAVVLLGIALFFYSSSVKAVDLNQIYEALKNVKNVYISRSQPDKSIPYQEEWISRTFNIRIAKTPDQYILWDIQNNVRKIKSSSSNSIEITPLQPDMYTRVKQSITGGLGFLPFSNIKEIPENSKWVEAKNKEVTPEITGTKIYDLTWTKDNYFYKCRFFIDPSSCLISRTEYYNKHFIQDKYKLISIEEVKYINDTEIEDALHIFQDNIN